MENLNVLFYIFFISFYIHTASSLKIEQIRGGDLSRPGQFQSTCSLLIRDVSICGCGILNDFYVVTAAHCVCNKRGKFKDYAYNVLAGVTDLRYSKTGVKISVEKVYVHKGYLPDRSFDDIAILQLKESLNIRTNPNLKALIVPITDNNFYTKYVNKEATIGGFGWDSVKIKIDKKTGKPIEIGKLKCRQMNYVTVKIISNLECRDKSPKVMIIDTLMCAKAKSNVPGVKVGVCSGDSGSPLLVEGNVALGILSTSPFGCDESEEAAVYTRLGPYYKFIDDIKNGRSNENAISYIVKGSLHPTLTSIVRRFYPFALLTKTDDSSGFSNTNCTDECSCLQ